MLKQNLPFILCLTVAIAVQINGTLAESLLSSVFSFFNTKDPKIINGTKASWNVTGHQVSIRRRFRDNFYFGTGHICGGSLISNNVVLSAAHCFVNYDVSEPDGTFLSDKAYIVVMGNLDRFEYNNNTLVFDIRKTVKRVKKFNLKTYDDDIVLVMLSGTVPAKHPTVRPINLNSDRLENNTICQATGWGRTEEGSHADILMTVDLPIISFDECTKTEIGSNMTEGMICAGYLEGEKDACDGDSGGPLVCKGLQAGIVSYGSDCALPLSPGVYTDVAFYKNWILEQVALNNGTLPKFAGDGGGDGDRDGAKDLNCSIFLVSSMLIFNFILRQVK